MKKTQSQHETQPTQPLLPMREGGVFSWRVVAVVSLIACIAIEVLFNLLPIDHNTTLLFWFFPSSLLLFSQHRIFGNIRAHNSVSRDTVPIDGRSPY